MIQSIRRQHHVSQLLILSGESAPKTNISMGVVYVGLCILCYREASERHCFRVGDISARDSVILSRCPEGTETLNIDVIDFGVKINSERI